MRSLIFRVDGPLLAYRRIRDKGGYRNYDRFKRRVLWVAMAAGFRRCSSSRERVFDLGVEVYWKKAPRIDASNVLKGIEDALFDQDRYVLGVRVVMTMDTGSEEHAIVRVVER
jgi:hypothetical protein